MATRKPAPTRRRKKPTAVNGHVWSVIVFAAGVLVLLFAIIPGESGWQFIHNVLRGLFGGVVFLIPLMLVYVAVMMALDKTGSEVAGRLIEGGILAILLSAAVQILFVGELVGNNWFQKIQMLYKEGVALRGGGAVSFVIAAPLLALFKRTGGGIIVCVITFVFLMVFSGKSIVDLFNMIINPWRQVKNVLAESSEARVENRRLRESHPASHATNQRTSPKRRDVSVPRVPGGVLLEDGRETFIPSPGVRHMEKQEEPKRLFKKSKHSPPNADVPPELLSRPVDDFDIPISGVTADDIPVKKSEEDLPEHPVASPKITPDKLEETVRNANSDLEKLIKKAVEVQVSPSTLETFHATETASVPYNDDKKQLMDSAAEEVLFSLSNECGDENNNLDDITQKDVNVDINIDGSAVGADIEDELKTENAPLPWEESPDISQGKTVSPADTDTATVSVTATENSAVTTTPIIPKPPVTAAATQAPTNNASGFAPKDSAARLYQQNDKVNVYEFPPITLLRMPERNINSHEAQAELKQNADILVDTLKSFGVQTRIVDINRGPTVTRYELQPSAGVKISKITGLADDIALNLAAAGVRIEAPIPGKAAVGIEVPNKFVDIVTMGELVDTAEFQNAASRIAFALGRDIAGNTVVADIAKMPHVLIAGSTGSGKSVCINSIIMSLLYKASPDQVRILMIDPKVVELGIYNGIPHLLIPVVTDPKKAAGALAWAVNEMLKRYKMFAESSVRDIKGYNEHAAKTDGIDPLPQIVLIIDELADLMMAAPGEVEDSICRLAQMARAAGMHLVIATQRPSVDIITGVIKANIPSRIAFAVSSQVDSRTILDGAGAEKLLGRGDMLFYPSGMPKPIRVQGCFVTDQEVESVVSFIKRESVADYDEQILDDIDKNAANVKIKGESNSSAASGDLDGPEDEMLDAAIDCIVESGQASTSYLQRRLKLGYARAARIMDELERQGIIGAYEGSKPRAVLMSKEQRSEMKLRK